MGHGKKVTSVTFSLTTSLVVSGSEDTTVKVWDACTGSLLHTIQAHTSGVNSIVFSPNGRLLASASFDDRVRLWLTDTWELHAELKNLPDNDVNVSSHLNELTGGATRSHPVSLVDLTRSPNPDLSDSGLHIPPSIIDSIGRGTDAYPSTMPTSYGLVNPHDKTTLQTIQDDTATEYSIESGGTDSGLEYVWMFAHRLSLEAENDTTLENVLDIPQPELGDILRTFAGKLHEESKNPFEWEASVTLHRKTG
jgi:WD40 repeat protein